MRLNGLHRATLTLISVLSLASTGAVQAGNTQGGPVDNKDEKITITVRATEAIPAVELHRTTLALVTLLSLAETGVTQAGQTRSNPVDNSKEKVEVAVKAADLRDEGSYKVTLTLDSLLALTEMIAAQSGQTSKDPVANSQEKIAVTTWAAADTTTDQRLSQNFSAAGLKAIALLRECQRRIAYTIRLHLPISESSITADRDQATEALRSAALLASNDVDQAALHELLDLFATFQRWSDALIEGNKTMELGRYYTSPTGLNDDPVFRKTEECAKFLAPMLASRRLAEDRPCQ